MATAGSIVVDLLMRTGSFETDARRAERQMRQMQRNIDRTIKRVGMFGLAVAGTFAAAMKSANNYMAEIGYAAERTSVSAESFSGLAYAAKDASLSQGELERALRRSTEAINHGIKGGSKQANALKALGVSSRNAAGDIKTADEMLVDLAERFSKLEPGARKTGLVLDLFGQQLGQKVIPFLNKGRDGIQELTDEARNFGLVIDNKAARAADQFNANLLRMSSIVKGASVSLANEYLPVISKFIELSIEAARETDGVLSSIQGLSNDYALPSWFKTALVGFAAVIDVVVALAKAVNVVILAFRAAFADINLLAAAHNKMMPWNWFSDDATKKVDQALESRNKKVAEHNKELIDLWTYDGIKLTRAAQKAVKWMEFQRGFVGPMPQTSLGQGREKPPITPIKSAAKLDEGQRYIQQMQERIALLGKETEYERLLAQISIGAIKFKSKAQKDEALAQAQTLDFLNEQMQLHEYQLRRDEDMKSLREQQLITQQQLNRDLEAMGMTSSMKNLHDDLARVEDRYRGIMEAWRNSPLGLSDDDLELIKESLEKELDMVRGYHEKKLELQQDWALGATLAVREYVEEASNLFAQMNNVTSNALRGMEDALVQYITTGKMQFSDFARSVIADMVRMTVKAMILGPLMRMMGFSGGGSVGGPPAGVIPGVDWTFAEGGFTGIGGKYEPAGIVHKGEYVFSKEAVNRIGVGVLERLHRGYATGGLVGGGKTSVGEQRVVNNYITISTPDADSFRRSEAQTSRQIGLATSRALSRV